MKKNSSKAGRGKAETSGRQLPVSGKVTIGLDLGDKWTHYCVIDSGAAVIERGRVHTRMADLRVLLKRYEQAEVGMETGTHCGWVSRTVSDCGHEPVVGHARELQKRYPAGRKNDRNDAESMARILRADRKLFHPVQLRSAEEQADLAVIRSRAALVEARTQLVNTVRSLTKNFGVQLAKCSTRPFAERARETAPEQLRPALDPLLRTIEQLNAQIGDCNATIKKLDRERYRTETFQQVGGVGTLTALTYRLTIWNPDRFRRSRDVGPYLGLTTAQHQSGETERENRISRAGNNYLRGLLVQSAHYILNHGEDSALKRFGQRLIAAGGRTKKARKRAAVAVARKLAVLLHRLWYGDVYEPLHGIPAEGTAAAA